MRRAARTLIHSAAGIAASRSAFCAAAIIIFCQILVAEAAVRQIFAAHHHNLAILDDGTLRTWGWNYSGQITTAPQDLRNVAQAAGGYGHSIVVLTDGSVVAWGNNDPAVVPAGLPKAKQVAATSGTSLVLLQDGSVRAWGPSQPTVSQVPSDLINVKQISAIYGHGLALLEDGSVRAWGSDGPEVTRVIEVSGVAQVVAGDRQSFLLLENGTIFSTGSNDRTTPPNDLVNVKQLSGGPIVVIAVLSDGSLRGWGSNLKGQLSFPDFGQRVEQISVGMYHALALLEDGTVQAWGNDTMFDGRRGGQALVPPDLLVPRSTATNTGIFSTRSMDLTSVTGITAAATNKSDASGSGPAPTAAIVGGVLGGLLVLSFIVAGFLFARYKRLKAQRAAGELNEEQNGAPSKFRRNKGESVPANDPSGASPNAWNNGSGNSWDNSFYGTNPTPSSPPSPARTLLPSQ